MQTEVRNRQLPLGEVTEQAEYKEIADKVIKMTFNKGKSEKITNAERNIKIAKIKNAPFTYMVTQAFCEKREIFNSTVPVGYTQSVASRRRDASEYDRWAIGCPEYKQMFGAEKNEIIISDSQYVESCNTCGSSGQVPCGCYNGKETCPTCNGHGGWNCGCCGGRGKVQCDVCYGRGYTIQNEVIGYDKNNLPIYGDVKYTCSKCAGMLDVTCNNCGGSGYITCRDCGGYGQITCRRCKGTTWLVCHSCGGAGYFLHSVRIHQDYDNDTLIKVVDDYNIAETVYGKQHFAPFAQNNNDRLIGVYIDGNPINEIPIQEMIPNMYSEAFGTANLMTELENIRMKDGDAKHVIQYRILLYQRAVVDVEYEFQNQTYRMLIDGSTGQALMDKNPYENVATDMLKDLEEIYKQGRLKSFLEEYDEFLSITKFDNVAFGVENVKSWMTKLNLFSIAITVLAGLMAAGLMQFPLFHFPAMFRTDSLVTQLLPIVLGTGLSGYLAAKFWKKLANDNKWITWGVLAGISVLLVVVLTFIIVKIGW